MGHSYVRDICKKKARRQKKEQGAKVPWVPEPILDTAGKSAKKRYYHARRRYAVRTCREAELQVEKLSFLSRALQEPHKPDIAHIKDYNGSGMERYQAAYAKWLRKTAVSYDTASRTVDCYRDTLFNNPKVVSVAPQLRLDRTGRQNGVIVIGVSDLDSTIPTRLPAVDKKGVVFGGVDVIVEVTGSIVLQ